jgi:putative membrane protein
MSQSMSHVALAADIEGLWLRWNLDPILILGLAGLSVGYWLLLGPLRKRYGWAAEVDPRQPALFTIGMALVIVALVSPLDAISDDYLFSAHMIQHMLLAVVVPPIWVLSLPGWGIEALLRVRGVRPVARLLTNPIVAFALLNADIWIWHAPALYDATLVNVQLHIFEHLSYVALGVLFWLPVLSRAPALRQLSLGASVLYLFVACQPMVALGALLTFSSAPLYHPYVVAPRLWGSTPLGDQQLGGLIMWLPSTIPYLAALSAIFFSWVGEQDRRERAAAGESDEFASPEGSDIAALNAASAANEVAR